MGARKVLTGTLEGYWEQGMEGRIEYAFYPDRAEGQAPSPQPIRIANSQRLRIFAADGQLLWEGGVELVPRRGFIFYEQHDLPAGIWNDSKQKGVPYGQWIAWFWHDPPPHAELLVDQDGDGDPAP